MSDVTLLRTRYSPCSNLLMSELTAWVYNLYLDCFSSWCCYSYQRYHGVDRPCWDYRHGCLSVASRQEAFWDMMICRGTTRFFWTRRCFLMIDHESLVSWRFAALTCPAWSLLLLSETRDNTIVAQASPDLTRTQHISERASTHGIFQQALYLIDLSHTLLYADHSGFGSFDT